MKKVNWIAGLFLLVGSSAALADQVSGKEELKLAHEIRTKLSKDADLKNNKIDVVVDNGVATLKGTVDTQEERSKAESLARVGGVVRVDDQLDVGSKGVKAAVTDTAITTKLKADILADETLRHGKISVTTNNGVVVLTGSVPSEAARQKAVQLTRTQDGVMRVDDKLTIAP
jgi:hyperosmotically inducible periplasmic protein